jgi:hypothetical protein
MEEDTGKLPSLAPTKVSIFKADICQQKVWASKLKKISEPTELNEIRKFRKIQAGIQLS